MSTAPPPKGADEISPTEALERAKRALWSAEHTGATRADLRSSLFAEAQAYAGVALAGQAVTPPEERIELVEAERAVGIWQERETSALSILAKLKASGAVEEYDTNQLWGKGEDDNVTDLSDKEAALWERLP